MIQTELEILSNERLTQKHYRMSLYAPSIAKDIRPGQFLHLRCSESFTPLLRRPFSIHRTQEKTLDILYQVVGKGTEVLSQKKKGERLSVLGPLGNGFSIDKEANSAILVAGGIGIAPLVALAEKLASRKKIYALIGAKTKELVLYEKEFKDLGIEVKVATEDGSYGQKGMATDLLKDLLQASGFKLQAVIYACGPKEMLKEVAEISGRNGLKSQASLEERMGCGLGACLGCVVRLESGYRRVCKDGPIFNLSEVVWE